MPTIEFQTNEGVPFTRKLRLALGATEPAIQVQLKDDGDAPRDFAGSTVTFSMEDEDGTKKIDDQAAVLVDGPNAIFEYQWDAADISVDKAYSAQFKVVDSDGGIWFIPNAGSQKLIILGGDVRAAAFEE